MVADILKGFESSSPDNIIGVGNDVFFEAESPETGRQLWRITYNTVDVLNVGHVPSLGIFPNPATKIINFNAPEGLKKVEMYNTQGQLVMKIIY